MARSGRASILRGDVLVVGVLVVGVVASLVPTRAGAAAAAAMAPRSSQLFKAYHRLCLTPQGEPSKALALAAAQGWVAPAPDDRLPLGALSMTDGQQREAGAAGAKLHLTVGHAADPAGLGLKPRPWRVCIVSSETPEPDAASALAAWAGVPPARGSNPTEGATGGATEGATLFVIAQSPNARRSADGLSDAQIQTLVDRRQIVALGSNRVESNTILLYAMPAP